MWKISGWEKENLNAQHILTFQFHFAISKVLISITLHKTLTAAREMFEREREKTEDELFRTHLMPPYLSLLVMVMMNSTNSLSKWLFGWSEPELDCCIQLVSHQKWIRDRVYAVYECWMVRLRGDERDVMWAENIEWNANKGGISFDYNSFLHLMCCGCCRVQE